MSTPGVPYSNSHPTDDGRTYLCFRFKVAHWDTLLHRASVFTFPAAESFVHLSAEDLSVFCFVFFFSGVIVLTVSGGYQSQTLHLVVFFPI